MNEDVNFVAGLMKVIILLLIGAIIGAIIGNKPIKSKTIIEPRLEITVDGDKRDTIFVYINKE